MKKIFFKQGVVRLLASILLLSNEQAYSADDTIITDRPDFVESSVTVEPHHFQIETSVEYAYKSRMGVTTKSWFTPSLLRYGVAANWELRLESDGMMRMTEADNTNGAFSKTKGLMDLGFGTKWHVLDEVKGTLIPSLAWLFRIDTPSGARALRGKGYRPTLLSTAEWELPKDFGLGVMSGLSYGNSETYGRYLFGVLGIVLNAPVTEKVRGMIEFSSPTIAQKKYGGSEAYINAYMTYLLNQQIQLDCKISKGLTEQSNNYVSAIGISKKF